MDPTTARSTTSAAQVYLCGLTVSACGPDSSSISQYNTIQYSPLPSVLIQGQFEDMLGMYRRARPARGPRAGIQGSDSDSGSKIQIQD